MELDEATREFSDRQPLWRPIHIRNFIHNSLKFVGFHDTTSDQQFDQQLFHSTAAPRSTTLSLVDGTICLMGMDCASLEDFDVHNVHNFVLVWRDSGFYRKWYACGESAIRKVVEWDDIPERFTLYSDRAAII